MEDFDQYMNNYQTQWRRDHLTNQDEGEQHHKRRPWILPRELWEEGLLQSIRSDKDNSLPAYLDCTGVQKHDGVHNLKSSWVQCSNLYFAFREDREILAGFLHEHVSPLIETVDRVELEWAEKSPLDPSTLLGEPHGQRGKNQTSPDIAFLVNGGHGIVLTENKLTEHSFYPCSGRKRTYGNPAPQRCLELSKVYNDPTNQCYMLEWAQGERTARKYWDYIKFTGEALETLKCCPAATAGYQLFRQQSLAEGLAIRGNYEFVISSVAYDSRNQTLIKCLKSTGIDNFASGWGRLFNGKAKFTAFTHQQLVQWVYEHDRQGKRRDWLEYVCKRYGYGVLNGEKSPHLH